MSNIVMFPFAKSKRALESLAGGTKLEPPKGYAETKARVERINNRPKDVVIDEVATSAAKRLADELFRKAFEVAGGINAEAKKQESVPDNAGDLHFLVKSFLIEFIKVAASNGDVKTTFAVSDEELTPQYREAVLEAILGLKHKPKGPGKKQ